MSISSVRVLIRVGEKPFHLTGFMHTDLSNPGDHVQRNIDIEVEGDPVHMDPVELAYRVTEGVIEVSDVAGYGALHGWSMPYRASDGSVAIFEFDFDGDVDY